MKIFVVLGYWEEDTKIFKAFKIYKDAEKYVIENGNPVKTACGVIYKYNGWVLEIESTELV